MDQHEKVLAARRSRKKWAEANKERERERNRKWFQNNPLYASVRAANRKALLEGRSDGTVTVEAVRELFDKFGNKCLKCGAPEVTMDHVIPISWPEGQHSITNIQPLCKSCNLAKGNRSAADYRPED